MLALAVALGLFGGAACGDVDHAESGAFPGPGPPFPDAVNGADIGVFPTPDADSPGTDVLLPLGLEVLEDVGPEAAAETAVLSPPAGAERVGVVIDGERAAWIERRPETPDEVRLVVWDFLGDDEPRELPLPYLQSPSDLSLSGDWLVFVDSRYGDEDVFAVDLTSDREVAVVARPGRQTSPDVLALPGDDEDDGALVAWQDCRACINGGSDAPREIYSRTLPDGPEARVTDDEVADARPRLTLDDSDTPLIAWVVADTGMAVETSEGRIDHAVGPSLGGEVTVGLLAFRPRPYVINPDSMIPADVFVVAASEASTSIDDARALSRRDEQWDDRIFAPVASAGRVAWLSAIVGTPEPDAQRLVVTEASASPDDAPLVDLPAFGAADLAITDGWVAYTAPAPAEAETAGLPDVRILPLPLP